MEKDFEFKGYFWLPENPKEEVAGILKFNQNDGIDLQLIGQFKTFINPSSRESNVILGFTSDGKKITLLNCYEYSRSFGFPGFRHSSISAIYLLLGEHFKSSEDVLFDSMKIAYEDMNHWLDISGFEKPQYDADKKEVVIKYKMPDNLNYPINEDWKIDIEFSFFSPMEYFRPVEKAEIRQIPEIVVRPNKSKNFKEFQNHFQTLNSFFSICYFIYPKTNSIEFFIENQKIQDSTEEKASKVKLYFQHGVDYSKYKKHDSKHTFLISYADVSIIFQELLKKWFDLKEKIEAAINILTECFMNRRTPMEFHFLGLAQSLENMHRRITGEDIFFKKRIDAMITNVPQKISLALLSNEINFAERITQNRNYFTHYDKKLEGKAAPLSELFVLSEKMKIILLINLMKKIGLSDTQVEQIILEKSVFLFNHLIKYKREENKSDDYAIEP